MQVRSGFSDLGRTADGIRQAYLTFTLQNTTATDMSMVDKGVHLQRLEVSANELRDISHLRGKASLVYLNIAGEMPLLAS